MELLGKTALVTGASRGLGVYIARELARNGMNVVLVARSEAALTQVQREIAKHPVRALAIAADIGERTELERVAAIAAKELGAVDLLVNNAAIESARRFEQIDLDEIDRAVRVNLTAAMTLTRLLLPGMLARRSGHVVNISSLAGLAGSAHNELYSATKHGLVGFTRALRASVATAPGTGVGASVICPGFIAGSGMFEAMRRNYGVDAPWALGSSPPEKVARAVVAAARGDLPDVIINPGPTRMLMAASVLFPAAVERLARRLRIHEPLRRVADARSAD